LGACQAGAIAVAPLGSDAQRQDFRAILFGDCTGNWRPAAASAAFARRSNESLAGLGRFKVLDLPARDRRTFLRDAAQDTVAGGRVYGGQGPSPRAEGRSRRTSAARIGARRC
jgi:hypothetical protein